MGKMLALAFLILISLIICLSASIQDGSIRAFSGQLIRTSSSSVECDSCSSCNTSLSSANAYVVLTAPISSSGDCITVVAENVTLDCQNNEISGDTSGSGIYVADLNNVTVNNCTVNNFSYGIYFSDVNNSFIYSSTVYNNDYGIEFLSSSNNTFVNNVIYNNSEDGFFSSLSSDNNTLTNNTIYDNLDDGIYFSSGSNNTLINDTSYNNSYGIRFSSNSNNNTLINSTIYNNGYGIYLDNSLSNIFNNNTVYNSSNGIYFRFFSDNNTLTSNTVYDNFIGIYLENSSNTIFDNNRIYNSTEGGIYLLESSNSILTNNIAYNNKDTGIGIDTSSNSTLINNTVYYNRYGIEFRSAPNNTVINNIAYNNSDYEIVLDSSSDNSTLFNNTVYNSGYDGIVIYSSNNILINNTAYNNLNAGIYIGDSLNNTITNNTIYENGDGIYISNSSNNIFDNNIAYNNKGTGIYLYYFSENNTLINNIAYNTLYGEGIFLGSESLNTTLINNTAYNNDAGIYLENSSNNNTLTNNTIYDNDKGIYLENSSNDIFDTNAIYSNTYGLYINLSSDNIFINNTINSNGHGVYLYSSSNNNLTNNTVKSNEVDGLEFSSDSTGNIINDTIACYNYLDIYDNDSNTFNNNTCNSSSPGSICVYSCPLVPPSECNSTVVGNWLVNSDKTCSDMTILLYGNLTVQNAKLTLSNVTLKMMSSYDGERIITVSSHAKLITGNHTKITKGPNPYNYSYKFSIYGNASIDNTTIEYMRRGIEVYSSPEFIVNNSEIRYSLGNGITSGDSLVYIENSLIRNNTFGGIHGEDTNLTVTLSNITYNRLVKPTYRDPFRNDEADEQISIFYDDNNSFVKIMNSTVLSLSEYDYNGYVRGSIYLYAGNITLYGNKFYSNEEFDYYANEIQILSHHYLNITENLFNKTGLELTAFESAYVIENNTFNDSGIFGFPISNHTDYELLNNTNKFTNSEDIDRIQDDYCIYVNVTDQSGRFLPYANITIINASVISSGRLFNWSFTTLIEGKLFRCANIVVINATGWEYNLTPHTVTVTLYGYKDNSTLVTMNDMDNINDRGFVSKIVVLQKENWYNPAISPVITINSPVNGSITGQNPWLIVVTDKPANCSYKENRDEYYNLMNVTGDTYHSQKLEEVIYSEDYTYYVYCENTNHDWNFNSVTWEVTVEKVGISYVGVTGLKTDSAEITVNTDNPTEAKLYYGTTAAYGTEIDDLTFENEHVFELTGLDNGTLYHYKINLTDEYGNNGSTDDRIFITSNAHVFDVGTDLNATITNNITNTTIQVYTSDVVSGANLNISQSYDNPTETEFSVPGIGKFFVIDSNTELDAVLDYAIINITYSQAEVDAYGIDESTLRIYYYDDGRGTWEPYNPPDGGVNTVANYVWANTTHFSIFAIGGLKANGETCILDSECNSAKCAIDFDGDGSWCADSNKCMHNSNNYGEGNAVCNGYYKMSCSSGSWTASYCSNGCSVGICLSLAGHGGTPISIPLPSGQNYTLTDIESNNTPMVVGDNVLFTVSGVQHQIKIFSLQSNLIVLQISSTPFTVTVNVGETKLVDVNGDGTNDISIYLQKIEVGVAYLTFSVIAPSAGQPTALPTGQPTALPPTIQPFCGDGTCNGNETSENCIIDCPITVTPTAEKGISSFLIIVVIVVAAVAGVAIYFFVIRPRMAGVIPEEYTAAPTEIYYPAAGGEKPYVAIPEPPPEKVHQLKDYIKRNLARNIPAPLLRQAMERVGWTTESIETAFELATMPPGQEEKIISYVIKMKQSGFPDNYIEKQLSNSKYTIEEIKYFMKAASKI